MANPRIGKSYPKTATPAHWPRIHSSQRYPSSNYCLKIDAIIINQQPGVALFCYFYNTALHQPRSLATFPLWQDL